MTKETKWKRFKRKFNEKIDEGNAFWEMTGESIKNKTGGTFDPIREYEDLYKFTKIGMHLAFISTMAFGFIVESKMKTIFFFIASFIYIYFYVQANRIENKIIQEEVELEWGYGKGSKTGYSENKNKKQKDKK